MILQTVSCLLSRLPSSRFSRKHSIDRKIGGSPYSILWRKSASLLSSRVREGTARSATRSYKVLTLCWFTADFFLVSQAWKRGARKFFFWRENEKNLAPQRKKSRACFAEKRFRFFSFSRSWFSPPAPAEQNIFQILLQKQPGCGVAYPCHPAPRLLIRREWNMI